MPLSDTLADLRYKSAQRLKPDISARMDRQIAELQAKRADRRPSSAGTRAQSFDLPTADGGRVSSAGLLARGPLVAAFFRGTWCSFCSAEMLAFAAIYDEIVAMGAAFVAITPERPELTREWIAKHDIPYPIAFDEGNATAEKFGLVYDFTDDARDLYAHALNHDIASINGDGKWRLPMPGRFVIDRSGVIRDSAVNPDFRERPEPTGVFSMLETITPQGAARGAASP